MIEGLTERGKVNLHAKDLGINPRTAMCWWKHYQETGKHTQQIVENDSQLCADDIIDSLKSQFEDLKISKSQMNHHLRNNMLISIKKPTFDPMTRNSGNYLQTRYEWFIKWKGSDLGYTKNCVFIDEAALKTAKQKRRKLAGGKKQRSGDIIIEEPTIEYAGVEESITIENNKPVAKGKQKDTLFSSNQKKSSKSENDSFELYVEDNSDDDFQPVVTARKRKSRESIPQSGSQKRLKGKGKATDSEFTTTSSTGISTTDEPTMFNKITLDDYDFAYSSDNFDAPVVKRPFWGENSTRLNDTTKNYRRFISKCKEAYSEDAGYTLQNLPYAQQIALLRGLINKLFKKKEKAESLRGEMQANNSSSKAIKTAIRKKIYRPCNQNSIYYDAMASPKNHFKAFSRLAELSEAEQTKQFACFPLRTIFISCYMTLDSKIIHYHVLKSKKNPKTGSKFEIWGAAVDLNKKAFKYQGFQKSLLFQGTLETDGVGVSIIKQNTDTSRKSPKPNTEKKVDSNQIEHIEGLGQADLKSTEGKCVLIDSGRRDLMYCMKKPALLKKNKHLYLPRTTVQNVRATSDF
ncbi:hypothetical protein G6F37_011468 [Rhizopus arrhizus]|nr:hypothetical protein G6F38_011545 [Rhizopus arrhizus]KAG1149171.1 hypothetical protein G6F37_011468 [Rhizopus arrhizus]